MDNLTSEGFERRAAIELFKLFDKMCLIIISGSEVILILFLIFRTGLSADKILEADNFTEGLDGIPRVIFE
ncbi:hypothetical protein D3C71_1792230 [compost metagenome]